MNRKEERLLKELRSLLWGYPELLIEFEDKVKRKFVSLQEHRVNRAGRLDHVGGPAPDYLRVDHMQLAREMSGIDKHAPTLEVHYRRRPGVSQTSRAFVGRMEDLQNR